MNIYVQDTPHLSMARIRKAFFKYAPDWVREVDDFRMADVFFYWSHRHSFSPLPNGLDTQNAWHHENSRETADYYQSLVGKPRIFWLDALSTNGHFNTYPAFLSGNDVATSTHMPPHPNAVWSQVIDPEEFYCFISERLPKSVMVMGGHTDGSLSFQEDIVTELNALLADGSIQTLIGLETPETYYPLFPAHPLKVFARSFAAEDVYKGLNLVDYTLQTQVGVGMELLGFEGAFCGAQPIYPDTPYYRDHFGDDLGVQYIDTHSPLESLKDIFARPLEWREKHMARFIEAYSAKIHIPKFWEDARKIIEKDECQHLQSPQSPR